MPVNAVSNSNSVSVGSPVPSAFLFVCSPEKKGLVLGLQVPVNENNKNPPVLKMNSSTLLPKAVRDGGWHQKWLASKHFLRL